MLKIGIIQNPFFDHNSINITLVINDTKTTEIFLNTWKLNNALLNNPWVKKGASNEIKDTWNWMKI